MILIRIQEVANHGTKVFNCVDRGGILTRGMWIGGEGMSQSGEMGGLGMGKNHRAGIIEVDVGA
jgi:hypothetical protein